MALITSDCALFRRPGPGAGMHRRQPWRALPGWGPGRPCSVANLRGTKEMIQPCLMLPMAISLGGDLTALLTMDVNAGGVGSFDAEGGDTTTASSLMLFAERTMIGR